jgi:hypothetical protein
VVSLIRVELMEPCIAMNAVGAFSKLGDSLAEENPLGKLGYRSWTGAFDELSFLLTARGNVLTVPRVEGIGMLVY